MPWFVPVLGGLVLLSASLSILLKPDPRTHSPESVVPHVLAPDDSLDKANAHDFNVDTEKKIARLISRNHYLQPHYELVLSHTLSMASLQKYLKTLDDYSRIALDREISFSKTRALARRIGPGVDYLFDKQDVVVVPVFAAGLYNNGVREAVLLKSINDRELDVTDFQSYEFLSTIVDGDTVEFSLSNPQKIGGQLVSVVATPYENPAVRYYSESGSVVLGIRQFRSGYTGLIRSAIIEAQSSKQLIIDLRYSPGGDIYAMADWLSLLLPENQLIAELRTKRYAEPTELRALSGKIPLETQIVILISRFTASSAEIFARVLKSNLGGQVQLLGEATKGKCLAQKTYPVNSEFALVLSTNDVLLAGSRACNGVKLQADIKLPNIEFQTITEVMRSLPTLNE